MMKTPLTVFHGTSLYCARSLGLNGFENFFESMPIKEFIMKSWPIVLDAVDGDFYKTAKIFDAQGADLPISSPTAIQNIFLERTGTTYDYGDLFVTTCVHHASAYARSGPEISMIVNDLRKVVNGLNPAVSRELEDIYSHLFNFVKIPVHPIVLEINLDFSCHVLDERGLTNVTPDDLERTIKLTRDIPGFRDVFRVRGFRPQMISGYFDLSKSSVDINSLSAGPDYFEKIKCAYFSGVPD